MQSRLSPQKSQNGNGKISIVGLKSSLDDCKNKNKKQKTARKIARTPVAHKTGVTAVHKVFNYRNLSTCSNCFVLAIFTKVLWATNNYETEKKNT